MLGISTARTKVSDSEGSNSIVDKLGVAVQSLGRKPTSILNSSAVSPTFVTSTKYETVSPRLPLSELPSLVITSTAYVIGVSISNLCSTLAFVKVEF